jgi:hypothetical protein
MMGRLPLLVVAALVGLAGLAGCIPSGNAGPPGMRFTSPREHARDPSLVELARGEPGPGERALLVVFPRTACSGSASGVVVDERGRFLGAIAPGTAALLNVPADVAKVAVFSSVEVTAPVGTWHDAKRIALPSTRSRSGLVVRSTRWSARECATGQYFDVEIASKAELEAELGQYEIRWMALAGSDGQTWLDAHGARVAEVLTTPPSEPPGDLTHLILR